MKFQSSAIYSSIVQKINRVVQLISSPKLSKLRTVAIVFLFVLTLISGTGLLYNRSFDTRDKAAENAIAIGNYVQWWPNHVTPWVYSGKSIGGVSHMNYNRSTMQARLKADVVKMLNVHKPGMVILLASMSDLMPIQKTSVLPEGNVTAKQVWGGTLTFDYFDDLIQALKSYGVKSVFYPVVSGYGGPIAYPFSYYSKVGWFWNRPDWPNGLANPTTDAMRHPPATLNGSSYDWCSHTAGYKDIDCSSRHFPRTTDNIEETGLGVWKVYESPDMVFNGFDTALHDNKFHLYTPVPSLSSKAYRTLTRDIFKQIGTHYKSYDLEGYFLFQEPTYAHLRQNVNYCPYVDTAAQTGSTCQYEVDYSPAETAAYNEWGRIYRGFPKDKVTPIPFPVNATYDEFRTFNMAGFLLNLKEGLREGNSTARVMAPIFEDSAIKGMGVNTTITMKVLKPEVVIVEPPHFVRDTFKDLKKAESYIAMLKNAYPATSFVSYDTTYEAGYNHQAHDRQIAAIFQKYGYKQYWAPAIVHRCLDPEGYPHYLLDWNTCDKMTFRYRTPMSSVTATPSPKPTVTVAPVPTVIRGTNLLKNPSFEDGYTGWTVNTLNKQIYVNNAYPAKAGAAFIDMNSNAEDMVGDKKNTIFQEVATTVSSGSSYKFAVNIRKITNATQYFRVAVWGYDSRGTVTQLCTKFMPLNNSTTWNEYGCGFTATQNYAGVRVQVLIDTPKVNYNMDDAYFGR
jgi:Carbohydrate binding domain